MQYESVVKFESCCIPGVRYTIYKMSFGRRLELTRRVREIGMKLEFHVAGTGVKEQIEATVLAVEIDRLYLSWGLSAIEGLEIDGRTATPELLVSSGPEDLSREILAAIRGQCGLTDDERKN
jgi:hypothetical protein